MRETRPLVAGGNLFGAVVMLFATEAGRVGALQLAEGLVDLAAIALGSAAQVEKLEQLVRRAARVAGRPRREPRSCARSARWRRASRTI